MEIRLREVPCPVCGGPKYRVVREDTLGNLPPELGYSFTPAHLKTYRIVRCTNCGHTYCSPLPIDLFERYADIEDVEYLKHESQRLATAKKVIRTLQQVKKCGRLLDVGCSTGDFLQIAERYYEVEGVELSAWAAGIARAKGLTVYDFPLSELGGVKQYDVISLWGVIEHLEDPGREIKHIHRLMRDGGILCIWTGNVDSLTARVLGEKWWYFMGQHVQYFSEATLDRLVTGCGFAKVTVGNYPYVMNMTSIANSIGRYAFLSKLLSRALKSKCLASITITFALPGEMFAIYSKI